MSRWGRGSGHGRGGHGHGGSMGLGGVGSTGILPLDHLLKENSTSNCPSAAKSAATVGKWGITSFTSTRSTPYGFAADIAAYHRKPKQDQNNPLTVPVVESDAPPPKPKKFFKSRNVDPSENATLPTSSVAPPQIADKAFPSFSKREDKISKPSTYAKKTSKADLRKSPDKMEIPKLKIHVDKSPKNSKGKFFASKASKKDDSPVEEKVHLSPIKRYLVRNRDKVINYSEDRSNSPPLPEPNHNYQPPPPPPVKISTPKTSPIVSNPTTPTYVKPGLLSPTNKDGKPPIVLRISKGTSRLLSTDSEDVMNSPNTDRNSYADNSFEEKASAEPEMVVSPPQKTEGIKITIKCFNNKSKSKGDKNRHNEVVSESEKDPAQSTSRSTRASRRNQHKDSHDAEDPNGSSPVPGSDTYELYRTLASPVSERLKSPEHVANANNREESAQLFEECPAKDEISDVEMTLAQLDGKVTDHSVSPKNGVQNRFTPTRQEETTTGRPMRHRANINYNENASNYIDEVTTKVNKNSTRSYTRKCKKKNDTEVEPMETVPEPATIEESQEDVQMASADSDLNNSDEVTNESVNVEPTKSSTRSTRKAGKSPEFNEDVVMDELMSDTTEKKNSDKQSKTDKHVFKSPKRITSESSPHSGDNDDKPSVKLVITKKKGSIFKSRSLVNDGPGAAGKKRHVYKHKWADDGKGGQTPRPEPEPSAQVALQEFEEDNQELTRVTRYQKDKNPSVEDDEPEPYTSVKCNKNAKNYYTVVRNVKKAHQIQEIGEFQEFNDDVEYILDALQDNNPMSTRCLSAITLASKCTAPAFRMHVRAHGTVAKFFRALHDATNDQSLGLCTATVMFVLSQDRLNMDLDRESLELMLNLLESDVSHKDALDDCGLTSVQLAKNKERVRELCAEIKSQGKAKHLDLDNITVGHLAMETLLSLTSKRAGEWFKEELRALGGVDHILSTIYDCCNKIGDYVVEWSPSLLDLLRKADRCMKVLENVTQQNEENQTYLLHWKDGLAVDTLVKLFRLCDREIPLYPTGGAGVNNNPGNPGNTLSDALLPTLKVLVNLTHPFRNSSAGSTVIGSRKGVIDASLHLLLQAPNYLPDSVNFEFSVCVLLLLINLMQNNSENVKMLITAQAPAEGEAVFKSNKSATQALVDHFYKRVELARLAEQNTDAILDGEKVKEDDEVKEKKIKPNDDVEETVAKLLQKAGTHMEHTMVASYIVLLLGHVVIDSKENEAMIRDMIPGHTFQDMLTVLGKYFSFLNLTASAEASSVAHIKGTEKIINYLKKCDAEHDSSATVKEEQPSCSNGADYTSDLNTTNNSMSAADTNSESDPMSSAEMDTSFT